MFQSCKIGGKMRRKMTVFRIFVNEMTRIILILELDQQNQCENLFFLLEKFDQIYSPIKNVLNG